MARPGSVLAVWTYHVGIMKPPFDRLFHRFYFDLGGAKGPVNNTMGSPHVRVIGDVGVVCYVRLTQKTDDQGRPVTSCVMETRVWERQDGRWRHVHFHRSGGA